MLAVIRRQKGWAAGTIRAGPYSRRRDTLNLTPFLLFDGHCAEAMAFYLIGNFHAIP